MPKLHKTQMLRMRSEETRKDEREMRWFVSVGLNVTIEYEAIEADTKEEAERLAKDYAMEDIDVNNGIVDREPIVYCSWNAEEEEEE